MADKRDVQLEEARAALAFIFGMLTSIGTGQPIGDERMRTMRTRLQNALDGLPTNLGGEPRLPKLGDDSER